VEILSAAPFTLRARCKYCQEPPSFFLFIETPIQFQDFRLHLTIGQRLLKYVPLRSNSYLKFEPIDFKSMRHLTVSPMFASINSAKYSRHKLSDLLDDGIKDMLVCQCGETLWSFKTSELPHIQHRKSRTEMPKGFRLI
jgi:hypothetical protein